MEAKSDLRFVQLISLLTMLGAALAFAYIPEQRVAAGSAFTSILTIWVKSPNSGTPQVPQIPQIPQLPITPPATSPKKKNTNVVDTDIEE